MINFDRWVRFHNLDMVRVFHSQGRVVDFLPEISKNSSTDKAILDAWADDFTRRRIPFVVTDEGTFYTLWKEKVK